jgi:DNA replication protein DnaC
MEQSSFTAVRSGRSKRANDDLAIPSRYQKLAIEDLVDLDEQVAAARDAIGRAASVFLTGSCGVGKTHLAAGLLTEWYAGELAKASAAEPGVSIKPPNGRFSSAMDLMIEAAEMGKRGEAKFLRRYEGFDCLVIDDLGAEISSERQRHLLAVIIDLRYRRRRRTIITSNLSVQDLATLYDDRMTSRIVEMCEVIHLTGPDRRLTIGPARAGLESV